jgi:hypothetical protein
MRSAPDSVFILATTRSKVTKGLLQKWETPLTTVLPVSGWLEHTLLLAEHYQRHYDGTGPVLNRDLVLHNLGRVKEYPAWSQSRTMMYRPAGTNPAGRGVPPLSGSAECSSGVTDQILVAPSLCCWWRSLSRACGPAVGLCP